MSLRVWRSYSNNDSPIISCEKMLINIIYQPIQMAICISKQGLFIKIPFMCLRYIFFKMLIIILNTIIVSYHYITVNGNYFVETNCFLSAYPDFILWCLCRQFYFSVSFRISTSLSKLFQQKKSFELNFEKVSWFLGETPLLFSHLLNFFLFTNLQTT